MADGWIKLHRRLVEWEWYLDSKMVHLFLHLLLMANSEDGEVRGVHVRRGQYLTGRKALAKETGLSEQEVRTCLDKLTNTKTPPKSTSKSTSKATSELTIKSTNKFSIITICKYEQYQGKPRQEQPADQPADQPASQPASQPQTRSKEEKERNTLVQMTPKNGAKVLNGHFSEFWSLYPKKRGKADAEKAWLKLNPDDGLVGRMMSAVKVQMGSRDWTRAQGQYIPLPATWLNGRRWEDEIDGGSEWQ